MSIRRLEERLKKINSIGRREEPGLFRLAYSKEESEAAALFRTWCEEEGMTCREDAAGNLICRRAGEEEGPAAAVGSHLDTVYAGGGYDGTLGVLAGLEVISRLNETNTVTRYPVEVIVFRAEESSRFGMATIGSKLMSGNVAEKTLAGLMDRDGTSFFDAVKEAGYDPEDLCRAFRAEDDIRAFFELHIEQGMILKSTESAVGIVDGIAAPYRMRVEVEGKASHSGTTPMSMRQDALTAASELILHLEKAAIDERAFRTVATVGRIEAYPGGMNIVPGRCQFDVDIRSTDRFSRKRIADSFQDLAKSLEAEREVQIRPEVISEEDPVHLDTELRSRLLHSAESLGIESEVMMSGAGHDVMNMALRWPGALIFVPSEEGLSHHPDEYTKMEDILPGVDVLEESIRKTAEEITREVSS
ncbi:Zn-dependent hydrolase [Alkalicoccus urumqiensis]|uniref:Allantoate amidohydrolase n=1 Tax=Alkalicoccus urumqiensis TaxID=1548213 RepID=A0A2P6MLX2_ALKUR|nr:Zn-dependent hydrolase [Alkalicoccus urumqiensis]PRO67283.1 allantoate amidohydrolase [Alkalicoccus urumqiensis]